MGGMPVHISLTRSSSHADLFSRGSFSHTDPKDFKDGYALRYAGMLPKCIAFYPTTLTTHTTLTTRHYNDGLL
jgi:hypothetical protein